MLAFVNFLFNPIVWYVILGIVVAIVVTILCFKYEAARWITGTIFTIGFLVSVGFSIYSLNVYYSAEGGLYGYLNGLLRKNQVEVVDGMSYKLSEVRFVSTTNDNEFIAEFDIDKVYDLDKNADYGLFINDLPVSNVYFISNTIIAAYNLNFYSDKNDLVINDTLFITISFGGKGTHITLRTEGGGHALKYWNLFFGKNEFLIQVISNGYVNT